MIKKSIKELKNHNLPCDSERKDKVVLSLNENVYNCSKKVIKIFNKLDNFSCYPDDNCENLRCKIAKLYNVSKNNILIGNGSGEIIQILCRSFVSEGDEVISCVPTYPYYLVETVVENGKFIAVPLKNGRFDVDGIISKITDKTKLIYITNPNNPTGTVISKSEQKKLIESTRKYINIVFDEAYYEYVTDQNFPETLIDFVKNSNVSILRTFSKAYGLAAFRIGYLIAREEIIKELDKIRLTFNVSKISQLAASCALDDQLFIESCRLKNEKVKNYLYKEFDKLNIEYFKSQANFIMLRLNEFQAQKLKDNNIMVNCFFLEERKYIRLTIGKLHDMKKIIELIK